jgi:3-hydroxybutyryl-CoA dehydratase
MINGHFFGDLSAGMSANLAKTITEAHSPRYSAVAMDANPTHLDAEATKQGNSGERIAHDMLSAGLISGVLGTKLPGPAAIYMRQSVRLAAPVKIGQTVEVMALNSGQRRTTSRTPCTSGDELVIKGEADVQVPSHG